VRLRFFLALIIVTLFLNAYLSHASSGSSHGCAPHIPPPVPGNPVPTPAIPGRLVINEVLSLPESTWNCSEQDNSFSINNDSWVELYNPQSQPYNLFAAHASFDTGPNTLTVYLPLGAAIAPHGYLVLFPSVFSDTLIIKANLRLMIAGVIIDQISIPTLPLDQSYARIPDGSNFWQITNTPTIDARNHASQLSPQVSPTASSPNQDLAGSGYSTPTTLPVAGMQPAWSNLQFPTRVTAATAEMNSTPTTLTTSPTLSVPVNYGWDIHRRILLTVLMVALALMLFWCWRLFSTP
jgi:hypothetical protein